MQNQSKRTYSLQGIKSRQSRRGGQRLLGLAMVVSALCFLQGCKTMATRSGNSAVAIEALSALSQWTDNSNRYRAPQLPMRQVQNIQVQQYQAPVFQQNQPQGYSQPLPVLRAPQY